ncbi:hypothetical protein KP509_04G020300 [Ceratopteris richardii]|uniref:Uncharacterized protein n=1 Tax=Ceratopteris richardii TaxID=49495 RepID=A0A8T2UUY0_CERRI|nr:hypothetical protein KP509_04G020300 [Ceratopteris richardii]KAH7438559.1 hypothetical protein KP509_04G020300 [Ceratopteris richardii]
MTTYEERGSAVPGRSGAAIRAVPYFATPWIELGKLEEREKWQKLAVDLVQRSIVSELEELKHGLSDRFAQNRDLKQDLSNKIDQTGKKISELVDEYRKLLVVDSSSALGETKAIIQALQHGACDGYDILMEGIPDVSHVCHATVTEEYAVDEDEAKPLP